MVGIYNQHFMRTQERFDAKHQFGGTSSAIFAKTRVDVLILWMVNSEDPDQTARNAQADLYIHCLQMSKF